MSSQGIFALTEEDGRYFSSLAHAALSAAALVALVAVAVSVLFVVASVATIDADVGGDGELPVMFIGAVVAGAITSLSVTEALKSCWWQFLGSS